MTFAVVSYRTPDLLVRCLGSLEAEVRRGRAAVVVVDNASGDGSVAAARRVAPWAEVVEAQDNLGFGPAVNLVARRTATPWVAAVNADVALAPGALDAMLEHASDPRVGVIAPRLLDDRGAIQHSVGAFPTVTFTVALAIGAPSLVRPLGRSMFLAGAWKPERAVDVPWAFGALLLIRRAAFDQVGGFDEDLWLYGEDLDLAWRLDQAGWRTRYEPRARVVHSESAATSVALGEDRFERAWRATYAVIARRRGTARAWLTAMAGLGGVAARLAWMAPLARRSALWRRRRAAVRPFLRAHRQGLRARGALRTPPSSPS